MSPGLSGSHTQTSIGSCSCQCRMRYAMRLACSRESPSHSGSFIDVIVPYSCPLRLRGLRKAQSISSVQTGVQSPMRYMSSSSPHNTRCLRLAVVIVVIWDSPVETVPQFIQINCAALSHDVVM